VLGIRAGCIRIGRLANIGPLFAAPPHHLAKFTLFNPAATLVMDLFSDSDSISVVPSRERPKLSRAQKAFNSLIGKIEKQRALLAGWEAAVPRYQQRHLAELTPLIEAATRLRREFVFGLDRVRSHRQLGKADRRFVADLVREWAGELVAENGDEEMKALYNQYGGDFDKEEAAALSGMKAMLEDTLGLDLGDDLDMSNPEAFMEQMRARLDEEQAKEAAREPARPQRKKTAKQLAREEKLREEEQRVNQSMREIYRKLASALHPDREPDPEERVRKTELMQRVNQAYDKKDLLALLELQLKIEHIDQASLNSLSEERLAHFNKILREQLRELEDQVFHITNEVMFNLGIDTYMPLTPATLMRELDADIARMRKALRETEADLKAIQELATLKAWLKRMRHHRRDRLDDDFDGIPF